MHGHNNSQSFYHKRPHSGEASGHSFKHRLIEDAGHVLSETLVKQLNKETATDNIHSGIETRTIHVHSGHKVNKKFVKSPPIKITDTYPLTLQSTTGSQSYGMLSAIGTFGQFIADDNAANAVSYNAKPLAMYANASNTGGNDVAQTASILNSIMELKEVSLNMQIRCLSNVGAYVDVVVFQAKRNQLKTKLNPTDATYSFIDPFDYWVNSSQSDTFEAGPEQPASKVAGSDLPSHPFSRPWENSGWKEQYKLLKVHHMDLAAAAEQTLNVTCHMNMPIDFKRLYTACSTTSGGDPSAALVYRDENKLPFSFKSGGICVGVIFRGQIDLISLSNQADIAPVKLGIVVNRKTRYSMLKITNPKQNVNNSSLNVLDQTSGGVIPSVTDSNIVVAQTS